MKRLFDIISSVFGLIIASPFMALIALKIKKDSLGPVFYKSQRIGQNGRPFKMYKFRTMVVNADKIGGPSTSADDPRLTEFGKFLRSRNLDELLQLINILKGEMSFVGPRPEVLSEIETYPKEIREKILTVKPGMTDLATLANIHEEEILKGAADPHQTYRERIKPTKIRLGLEYIDKQSFLLDIKILVKTIFTALK